MGSTDTENEPFVSSEIVILGICRDVAKELMPTLTNLLKAFAAFKRIHIRVVESDSSDDTVQVLREFKNSYLHFDFESLGKLELDIPDRWERIAFCRNRAAEILNADPRLQSCQWVVVADLDGVNSELNSRAVASCWVRADWDVCTANQSAPYYDVFALRHPTWSPDDCWRHEESLLNQGCNPVHAREKAVYRRQKFIPRNAQWIAVDSAFGGLAIYKKDYFILGEYRGHGVDGFRTCEHVPFHEDLKTAGARIFINPALINSGWNEHNSQHLPINRFKRRLKLVLISFGLAKIFGLD